jgi:hypothetical protein
MSKLQTNRLLIIVPVTKMSGKLHNFRSWLLTLPSNEIKVLVVHDYADDLTSSELKQTIQLAPTKNIELIEKKLQSPGLARNIGLDGQSYDWVSFVDSDDFVEVSTLLKMIESAPTDSEIIIGNYKTSSVKGTQVVRTSESSDPKMDVALNPGIWRMLINQKVIGSVRFTPYKMGEDQLFLLDLDFFRRKLFFSDQSPYTYFKNFDGQLTSRFENVKEISNVIKHTINAFNVSPKPNQAYVGMLALRQIITEFKCYFSENSLSAFYKLFSNLISIRFALFPIMIKNFYTLLYKKKIYNGKSTYVILTGGLGNQLFQYAAALSRHSSNIMVEGHLGKPRLNSQGIPALFDFELVSSVKTLPQRKFTAVISKCSNYLLRSGMNPGGIEKTKLYKIILKVISSIVFSFWFKSPLSVIVASDNGYFDMPQPKKSNLLIGYFQSYKWAIKKEVKFELSMLKLKNESEDLRIFLNQYSGKSILSIHVRLGDYKDQNAFGLIEKSYYQEAIIRAKSSIYFDYIWLFSDEPSEALRILPSEILEQLVVVPNFDGSAAETLEAMRHCRGFIIANSSLSWWGAFLNYSSQAPLIIAPNPWFKAAKEPSSIIDPTWIRLPAWLNSHN